MARKINSAIICEWPTIDLKALMTGEGVVVEETE